MTEEPTQTIGTKVQIGTTWGCTGVIAIALFSLAFDRIWFQWLSWQVLHIPMGQAGAMYPMFFIAPVVLLSIVYQLIAQVSIANDSISLRRRVFVSLVLPCLVVAVFLVAECPVDGGGSYISYFFRAIFK